MVFLMILMASAITPNPKSDNVPIMPDFASVFSCLIQFLQEDLGHTQPERIY